MAIVKTYHRAGVNIAAAEHAISGLSRVIRATHGPAVLPDKGQFASLFRLAAAGRWRDPVLVSSTDGVGTKLKVAQQFGRHEGIGIDVVAMNTNDVLAYGARPLFFLDYIAMGRLNRRVFGALVRGVAKGCALSGCALVGGETAEMPGVYKPDEYDVAGFCVGVVERAKIIDGSQVRADDRVIGLASSGVHANGFSLARAALGPAGLRRFKRQLLEPTRIYVKPVLAAAATFRLGAIAHVTGGGLARRLSSLTAKHPGLRARWEPGSWPVPAIFEQIQAAGRIDDDEMHRTFNMGIGMAVACRRRDATALLQWFAHRKVPAWIIGRVEQAA